MKKLDKYVAVNFIIGYVIAFSVLMGLRIVIDLFVNLDEFAEGADMGGAVVLQNVFEYYKAQMYLYFRDFAGMITVVAAVFSVGKMVRNNELIAVMASGVSLKRILMPILLIALVLTAVYVIDQEVLIPNNAEKLVRSHDTVEGKKYLDVWFIEDAQSSLICSPSFEVSAQTMHNPIIFIRQKVNDYYFRGIAQVRADSATYIGDGKWQFQNGIKMTRPQNPQTQSSTEEPVEFYQTDITPKDIPIRRQANFLDLLSSAQLAELLRNGGKIKDRAELYAQKHDRITTPIINFIMLMVALPILICREPKDMKAAVTISFTLTSLCFIFTFLCKMAAGEFGFLRPEIWSWLPVAVFFPVAIIQLDSMKT
jgi:lipopolysaccharide export LptBFGC system permease protein LptF